MKAVRLLLLVCLFFFEGCQAISITPTALPIPSPSPTASIREFLTFSTLMNGVEANSPVNESALTPPKESSTPDEFEGRLELLVEKENGKMEVLRGALGAEYVSLPEFDFEYVQENGHLIPVKRGISITDHPVWNIILEPGRVWQEAGDNGLSRASLPFALVIKGGNTAFNGTMTFLFDEQQISYVWYQVTQETSSYTRANLWGMVKAVYHPEEIPNADQIRADFRIELAGRLPVKSIEKLAEDFPGVDVRAFGQGVSPEHMTWYGLVVDGVNYIGGCQTRFGGYPYCESMRVTSFSTAKSAFSSLALMRLTQKYGPDIPNQLIKDYVPEAASSAGNWEDVTFNHGIDMTSGNYVSPGYMVDDDSEAMAMFFSAQPYVERIQAAFLAPRQSEPGTLWVYRTSDTFILTRAMHNYLQSQEGANADIYEFVVDEVYRPLGIGPGAFTTIRTADDDWQGQAEGGYGLWWIPDDIAKLGMLLNVAGGKIGDSQVLDPGLLAAALQQDENDRGVVIDSFRRYNNAFWARSYSIYSGFGCEFWVPEMLGYSGNVVALFPNGITYYYFSDNREFTWDAALRESSKISPLCP